MPRNSEDARKRLQHAALELFAENGFDQTTAAQIAERAGVTERTFFRHFPDKREVLFQGQAIVADMLVDAIGKAPPDLPPIAVLHRACQTVTPMFEQNRRFSEPRRRIIAATPALQERETAKYAALTTVVADALQRRGIGGLQASLAAQAGLVVLNHAMGAWFEDASLSLDTHLDQAFAELQDLAASISPR